MTVTEDKKCEIATKKARLLSLFHGDNIYSITFYRITFPNNVKPYGKYYFILLFLLLFGRKLVANTIESCTLQSAAFRPLFIPCTQWHIFVLDSSLWLQKFTNFRLCKFRQ